MYDNLRVLDLTGYEGPGGVYVSVDLHGFHEFRMRLKQAEFAHLVTWFVTRFSSLVAEPANVKSGPLSELGPRFQVEDQAAVAYLSRRGVSSVMFIGGSVGLAGGAWAR